MDEIRTPETAAGGPTKVVSPGSVSGPQRFLPGQLLGTRYRIVGLLGRGGMGEVYRADDLKLNEGVALKLLPERLGDDADTLARFHSEVRLARRITHPNVCRVYDIGEAEGLHFLTMELIEGDDLAILLRRIGRLPVAKAIEIARQLCAGLGAAHARGVLHRDLKPANVMLDAQGRARITDFGLASLQGEIQQDEDVRGTPAYMAPEQLQGERISVQTDLYCLGLVLWELLTGERPFPTTSWADLARSRRRELPPLSEVDSSIPASLDRTLREALDPEPGRRPRSAQELGAALPGGGDLLEAALRAGEIPSPDLVAAAPREGSLAPRTAVVLLAVVVTLLGIGSWARSEFAIAQPKSPEVLRDRALEHLEALRPDRERKTTADGLRFDPGRFAHITATDSSPERWDRLADPDQSPFVYWLLTSAGQLPSPPDGFAFDRGERPPPRRGEAVVEVDVLGQLRFLQAPGGSEHGEAAAVQVGDLFRAAGLSLDDARPVDPSWEPGVFADRRLAWEHSIGGVAVRVEAATLGGRLVAFAVLPPWAPRNVEEESVQLDVVGRFLDWTRPVLGLLILGLAGLHLRRRRGDRRGALRLAVTYAVLIFGTWVVLGDHTAAGFAEFQRAIDALGRALGAGAVLWLAYLALEPILRRHRPESIVSWTRLLSGGFRDPLVGRDLLLGVLLGLSADVAFALGRLTSKEIGLAPSLSDLLHTRYFGGLGDAIPLLVTRALRVGFLNSVTFLLMFLGLTLLLRRRALAEIVFLAAMATMVAGVTGSGGTWPGQTAAVIAALTGTIAVSRLGLLAMFCWFLVMVTWSEASLTLNLEAWQFPTAVFFWLLMAGLAAWGAACAVGSRSLLGFEPDERSAASVATRVT